MLPLTGLWLDIVPAYVKLKSPYFHPNPRVYHMRFSTRLLYYCPFQRATTFRQPGIKTASV
jgi:hypothetical protein